MIYEVSREVEAKLRAKKFPVRCYFEERSHRETSAANVLVFERDPTANEALSSAKGQQQNPRKHATRLMCGRVDIYARSSRAGAHHGDHQALADQIWDAVIVALEKIATESRMGTLTISSSRFLSPEERRSEAQARQQAESRTQSYPLEQWPGVVYRAQFSVERAVIERDFLGAAGPEAAAQHFAGRTEARLADDDTASIGCGS